MPINSLTSVSEKGKVPRRREITAPGKNKPTIETLFLVGFRFILDGFTLRDMSESSDGPVSADAGGGTIRQIPHPPDDSINCVLTFPTCAINTI